MRPARSFAGVWSCVLCFVSAGWGGRFRSLDLITMSVSHIRDNDAPRCQSYHCQTCSNKKQVRNHCTMVQNNLESRGEYWTFRLYICSFAHTAHSFTCLSVLALLAHSAALTRSLAREWLEVSKRPGFVPHCTAVLCQWFVVCSLASPPEMTITKNAMLERRARGFRRHSTALLIAICLVIS